MLRWLTAGESHGPALTAILEGLPAGVAITTADLGLSGASGCAWGPQVCGGSRTCGDPSGRVGSAGAGVGGVGVEAVVLDGLGHDLGVDLAGRGQGRQGGDLDAGRVGLEEPGPGG